MNEIIIPLFCISISASDGCSVILQSILFSTIPILSCLLYIYFTAFLLNIY